MKFEKIKRFAIVITFILISSLGLANSAFASNYFSVSPMYQLISLTPGQTYEGDFDIINPGDNDEDFYYQLRIEPFSTDNSDDISLVANGDYNQIVDWIELSHETGSVAPNETKEIRFKINVPNNAPAGGQYASIVVKTAYPEYTNSNVEIKENYETAHLIYADIAGETSRKGKLNNIDVPGFLFSGNIRGGVEITNEGNVHSQAIHTLQVFPLFSNEEIYTNEENPKKVWIMPGNTTYKEIAWEQTPSFGIFHVIYNVEFEGVNQKVDKMVIVCPLWLLFVILVIIFLIIFKILSGKKKN